ncbi:hypothetical protein DTO013E5_5995 [Penicillium roqueforti]|uniref:Genomic scaffold, ProqFM164S01 n=1 Tax=Penicillium roqueforti (strain FM164) TaxID=1365484 RepID=W6PZ70_PENRF|nr:uncharacterized protein LCP9604111_5425 [Penicillium roqueforti]CDM29310.1 unnamed protein product [Penicillium roqueforti FM164]KAF9248170.1 hypothetical protein LCP9604111_5425 [Penicillium roqueforti]KAI1836027.1 hypothetical protein CBS147337_3176 [Penicillium roqueforti]KAI2676877.1 hypothetical protein LCP963914a_8172 [Penicillium roqueforti]KAI2683049.1 hypothetical protein CBS147355_2189 [Penicillium roqueforti]
MGFLWYCCDCKFGPHDSALYMACIECGKPRCSRCICDKVSNNMSVHSHSHDCNPVSAYPTAVTVHSPRTPTLKTTAMPIVVPDLPGLRPLRRADYTDLSTTPLPGTRYNSATYMYICCGCGDGPKVYNHQPQCVQCSHIACSECKRIK